MGFGMFLLLVLYFYIFFNPFYIKMLEQKARREELQAREKQLQIDMLKYNANKEKMDITKQSYIDISSKLPVNQDEKFSIVDICNISRAVSSSTGDFIISRREPAEKIKNLGDNKLFKYTLKLNWNTTYPNFRKLLLMTKSYEVAYSIDDIMISTIQGGKLQAAFDMSFYGYEDKNAPVREWKDLKLPTGKDNIFLQSASAVSKSKNVEDTAEYIDKNKDFIVLLSTLNSPTSAITLGKINGGTDIFGANKTIENVDINFTQNGGKYYYSMKTEGDSYPRGKAEEFQSKSENIIIYIASQPRKYSEDKNTAVVRIHNATDRKVFAYVVNDDAKLPRATIVRDGNSIYVIKK